MKSIGTSAVKQHTPLPQFSIRQAVKIVICSADNTWLFLHKLHFWKDCTLLRRKPEGAVCLKISNLPVYLRLSPWVEKFSTSRRGEDRQFVDCAVINDGLDSLPGDDV